MCSRLRLPKQLLLFVLVPCPSVLKAYFWLCSGDHSWKASRDHKGCWELKSGGLLVRLVALPAVLSLATLQHKIFWFVLFEGHISLCSGITSGLCGVLGMDPDTLCARQKPYLLHYHSTPA